MIQIEEYLILFCVCLFVYHMFIQFREFLFISLIKRNTKQSLEVNPLYKYYTTVELSIIHLKVVRRKGKIKYIFSQGSR